MLLFDTLTSQDSNSIMKVHLLIMAFLLQLFVEVLL